MGLGGVSGCLRLSESTRRGAQFDRRFEELRNRCFHLPRATIPLQSTIRFSDYLFTRTEIPKVKRFSDRKVRAFRFFEIYCPLGGLPIFYL